MRTPICALQAVALVASAGSNAYSISRFVGKTRQFRSSPSPPAQSFKSVDCIRLDDDLRAIDSSSSSSSSSSVGGQSGDSNIRRVWWDIFDRDRGICQSGRFFSRTSPSSPNSILHGLRTEAWADGEDQGEVAREPQ